MNLDKDGFIVQADGNSDDTLNRVGTMALNSDEWFDKMLELEVSSGVFVRALGNSADNVSGDQLVPVFAAAIRSPALQRRLSAQLWRRLGFSQNTRTMHSNKAKVPDLLLPRVLPFLARYEGSWIPRHLADTCALLAAMVATIPYKTHDNSIVPIKKTGDDVDQDVNMVNTLFAIMNTHPTWVGKLAVRWYAKFRSPTLGKGFDNVSSGLDWYHRAASLGNPEVGHVQTGYWASARRIAGVKADWKAL